MDGSKVVCHDHEERFRLVLLAREGVPFAAGGVNFSFRSEGFCTGIWKNKFCPDIAETV